MVCKCVKLAINYTSHLEYLPFPMKKSTPKQQQPHSRTSRRYKSFRNFARIRLENGVALTVCPKCKEARQQHSACTSCGDYNGRQALNMEKKVEKITKIKA
jgi:large subunit ribosomal protein L32